MFLFCIVSQRIALSLIISKIEKINFHENAMYVSRFFLIANIINCVNFSTLHNSISNLTVFSFDSV